MPDYKEMYLKMMRATEKAIHILIESQREAEEIYISEPDPVRLFVMKEDMETKPE